MPLHEKCTEAGVDPFDILLKFAASDWKGLGYKSPTRTMFSRSGEPYEVEYITTEIRVKASSDVCAYLYPKLKSIDMKTSTPVGKQIIKIQWADENDNPSNAETNTAPEKNQPIDEKI